MTVTEKVSYLKGLAEGLQLDNENKSVILLNAIIDTLDEMANAMSEIELDVVDISDQVDAVDEDLAEVEDFVYDEDEDDEDFYEITCPECGETIGLYEDMLSEPMDCPSCGAKLSFELEDATDDEVE